MSTLSVYRTSRRWGMAGLVLAVAMAVFPLCAPVAHAAPKIESPQPNYDFGEKDNSETVSHTFTIKNAGDEDLKISDVRTSCGCTVAKLSKDNLAPGEETEIRATVNLQGRQGLQSKTITVQSNDPDTPQYRLSIKGTATAAISIEPKMVNFGRIADDKPHTETVNIAAAKDDVTFHIESVSSNLPQIETEVTPVKEGKEYKITVSTKEDLTPGYISGVLNVRTDNPQHPVLQVRLTGQYVGELMVTPSQILVRYIDDANRRTNQFLRVLPGRTKNFKVTDVVVPIEGMSAEIMERGDNDYLIKLTNMPVNGVLNGKELVIKTNVESAPEIRVPFVNEPIKRPVVRTSRG